MVLLFAFCCGAIVANIYYAQPIIELIAPDVGLSSTMASLIVSLTQIGYALGLFSWCRWGLAGKPTADDRHHAGRNRQFVGGGVH